MKIGNALRLRSRTAVLAVGALILTWLVVSRSLAGYLADVAPQAALWLDPRQSQALLNLADLALRSPAPSGDRTVSDQAAQQSGVGSGSAPSVANEVAPATRRFDRTFNSFEAIDQTLSMSRPVPPSDAAAVRGWVVTALKNDPINARALRILGQLAEADGDDTDASKFMQAAERLSLHERAATFWLLRTSTRAGDYTSAVDYADILMRTNPESSDYVVPFLAKISGDKEGVALIGKVLARDPPWRPQFVERLPKSVTDARTPLDVFLAMRNDSKPPTAADIRTYIYILLERGFYRLAYYTWLQFLPPNELNHAGLLFNGDFDQAPSGLPFDWTISEGSGVNIDIVPRDDKSDGHALLVDFQFGRADYHGVSELVVLAPGTYQFTGEYKGELVGPRGMRWRVRCAGVDTNAGESDMIIGTNKAWTNFAFTFTVPDKACQAQYVRLDLDARMASERLISGSIMFDGLRISRTARPATAGG